MIAVGRSVGGLVCASARALVCALVYVCVLIVSLVDGKSFKVFNKQQRLNINGPTTSLVSYNQTLITCGPGH